MKKIACAAIALLAAMGATPGSAATLSTYQGGTGTTINEYFGQSFLVNGDGSFGNIGFNFFKNINSAFADGNLYIFSSAYTGTVADLSSSSYLAVASAANNTYSFGSKLTLQGGSTYFAYADKTLQINGSGGDRYAAGRLFRASNVDGTFFANGATSTEDANFLVTGSAISAAVPEPTSWAMMMIGFGLVGGALRRRKINATVTFA